jgi:hypothetical protein
MENIIKDLRLSVSKTKTFLDCKAKYKYSYIEKLPKKQWSFHLFGTFCHKVLEDFHNAYINGSDKPYNIEMGIAYKGALQEFNEKMTPEMKKECWDIINKYLQLVSKDKKNNLPANVIACEKSFELEIADKVILNGMIDRIQIDADNTIHVCDYKTTKNKKFLQDDFFQLLTYAYVIYQEDPSISKVRASYILLRHDFEYITCEFSVPEILKVKEKYAAYASQINLEKDFVPNPSNLCRFCDFLDSCNAGKEKVSPSSIYGEVQW